MTLWTVFLAAILIALLLFMRVRGILWLAAGCLLLGGLIFSLRSWGRSRPVLGTALWTALLVCGLLVLGFFVPDIRLWELLYL